MKLCSLLLILLFPASGFTQHLYDQALIQSTIETTLPNGTKQEASIQTTFKNGHLKIITSSGGVEQISFVDRTSSHLVNLTQLMGKKIGFGMDLKQPAEDDSLVITVSDSTRVINGFNCRKALILHKKVNDPAGDAEVWFSTDYKFSDPNMGISIAGIDKLPGFPIKVLTSAKSGIKVAYSVLQIDTSAPIQNTAFSIPSEYEVMTLADYRKKVAQIMAGN